MFGIFLIVIGLLMLLQQMGIISGSFSQYIWPIIIILFGISLVKKRGNICLWGQASKTQKSKHKIVDEQ